MRAVQGCLHVLRRRAHMGPSGQLREFLVERYPGWTDGSCSLTSSECEPLSLHALLELADTECAARWRDLSLGYPSHNEGSPFLRHAIADLYECNLGLQHINVLAPQEGIYLAMRALLSPGDHVIATVPHYQSLSEVARSMGCEVSPWRPEQASPGDTSALRFEPSDLRALLRPGVTKAVVVNWPHNPTGAVPTPAELDEVVDACAASGCSCGLNTY